MEAAQLQRLHAGRVFVFGTGDAGELGLGEDMLERKKPMPLRALDGESICDIVCGGMHTLALTKTGKLWSWGCNDEGALGRQGDEYEPGLVEALKDVVIVKVACGDSISLALSDQGKLFCWGTFRSTQGAFGFSPSQAVQREPVLYPYLAKETFVDIAAGSDHCLALTTTGRVFVWGNGQQFQLGRRLIERRQRNSLIPEPLALRHIVTIGCGSYHSFAVSRDNTLYVWGLNNFQQCGLMQDPQDKQPLEDIITTPTVVTGLQGKGQIKKVVAGEHHSLVLMEHGAVYAFGRADAGQLGLSEKIIEEAQVDSGEASHKKAIGYPIQIPTLSQIVDIASGGNHVVAAAHNGTAYAWGFGAQYQLSNGTGEDEMEPIVLSGQKIEGLKIRRVAAGGNFSVIIATDI
ncbi:regulator of chromosome condensation 1/beta-lactamase-inhibitor protein II [Radiomyces spectabilis]|uniref:regulator of chromosome condensation 1/beta-lactamase-inhibitor protein II n=1 Tax=Radiomyces spectabilis TaxID=64574 RepID=UPI00221F54FE|nr:regulator of chromosome condensation 1/beta-lactamase-inhibitor protein II [Radiomyces spectabilis]KAI8391032.1 regulator of chromosome condensation 1/beta-lactamase-inhibitor protein II [Radiomyces spectabilis]